MLLIADEWSAYLRVRLATLIRDRPPTASSINVDGSGTEVVRICKPAIVTPPLAPVVLNKPLTTPDPLALLVSNKTLELPVFCEPLSLPHVVEVGYAPAPKRYIARVTGVLA